MWEKLDNHTKYKLLILRIIKGTLPQGPAALREASGLNGLSSAARVLAHKGSCIRF